MKSVLPKTLRLLLAVLRLGELPLNMAAKPWWYSLDRQLTTSILSECKENAAHLLLYHHM